MKLYLTAAGVYAGTQVEAKADGKGWTPEEVPVDKQGLIQYLNSHVRFDPIPDGSIIPQPTPFSDNIDETVEQPKTSEPTSRSIQMDEEWDRLPLARQLDFAARAMENARTAL